MTSKFAIFTICSNNCIPAARTLLNSASQHHPEADLFLCLADEKLSLENSYDINWHIVTASELSIENFQAFAFRYDIMAFNMALKPYMFLYLLSTLKYEVILYFDSDIEIFQPLTGVFERLCTGASVVLTPHLCSPCEDDLEPNDITIMRAGVFNLGFLGVSNCEESIKLMYWWARRVRFHCLLDFEQGLFFDQKFIDIALGFMRNLYISRDISLNVAYWNVFQRNLTGPHGGWKVDGRDLSFFHYSGFDPNFPNKLSKHTSRTFGRATESIQILTANYASQLRINGFNNYSHLDYAYGKLTSGISITPRMREVFRSRNERCRGNPFDTFVYELSPLDQATASELNARQLLRRIGLIYATSSSRFIRSLRMFKLFFW